MAIKEDGQNTDDALPVDTQTGPVTSQFVAPVNPDASSTVLTEDEAERKGDFTALLRIKLANAAREASEHFDVNGDGFIATSLSSASEGETSGSAVRDECGGYYAQNGDYYDKYGGHYDDLGYSAKNGDYTSDCGEHWDKKTGKITNADGTERKVDSTVVQEEMKKDPNVGKTVVQVDEQFRRRRLGHKPKKPKVDKKKASNTEGGGTPVATPPPSKEDKAKTEIVIEERKANGLDLNGPATAAEMKHAEEIYQWRLKHVNNAREDLSEFIVSQSAAGIKPDAAKSATGLGTQSGGNPKKPKFTAVSKEEAEAALGRLHVPVKEGAHVHTSADHGGPADHDHDDHGALPGAKAEGEAKPKDQKSDNTTDGANWYADSKGGYWDEFGGYYDKDGGYWEADGGYWDKYNVYTDVNGGRTWPDKSYLDPNFNYVDAAGCYYMPDGTQIKPPAGMDFKKQMQEAAAKHEEWHLPEELVPLLKAKDPVLPALTLDAVSPVAPLLAASLVPPKPVDAATEKTVKVDPVAKVETPIKLEPVKLSTNLNLTPLKLNTNFGSTTTVNTTFSMIDPKQNSTPEKPESQFQMCSAQTSPKNDFSSFFNNYHSFLTSEKPVGETKFYDLSNITLSPSVDPKTTLASLNTTVDSKNVVPTPKSMA